MRMGAFLLGGICGVAAVVYFTRNRNNMMMGTILNAGSSMSKAVNKMSSAMNPMNSKTTDMKDQSSASTDLGKVETIVNEDPSLKQQVNEILANNTYDKQANAFTV